MKSLILTAIILTVTLFTACNKEPGEGGTSTVSGKVWIVNLNASGDTIEQYYGMDQDVYVIYGEATQTYSDKFATSFDGSYTFTSLTPGKYTVFAYSDCDACLGGQEVVAKTIEITDKKQEITLEDLVIIK